MYSNAEKLAAVLATWARPAVSQIAVSKVTRIEAVRAVEQSIKSSGLVGAGYSIAGDIMPFVGNVVEALVEPMLAKWLFGIPDEALPELARNVVETAMQQPKFCVMDGLVEFDREDLEELRVMLEKNLPVEEKVKYEVMR